MNQQSNPTSAYQPKSVYNSQENFETLSKEDIYAQTRFVANNNSEDEDWIDTENEDGFNGYIEEYE